jgi:hypothetical protein
MHCFGKEYRVVCMETADKRCVIDIVPAGSALHLLVLKERQQRDAGIKIIAGSISLYDMGEGMNPEIFFLPNNRGGIDFKELSAEKENQLRHKIRQKFAEMMANNINSTLEIRPEIHQAYVDGVIASMNSQCNDMIEALDAPKSIAEERKKLYEERELKKARIRAERQAYLERRDAKYSPYHLTALQIKQLLGRD